MLTMQFTTSLYYRYIFLAVCSMVSLVNAIPVGLQERDVYAPPVLYPTYQTVWKAGEVQTVTWDTSNPPVNITNTVGSILLRKGYTTLPRVLAEGFDILSGSQEITVPDVDTGYDYRIVLFGDSGNFSPKFTIENDYNLIG